jgi:hypothetical protein
LSGWSSVDGGEIRYEDYTKYDGARTRAISAWNAVGRIHICPDDASHICDLEIDDVDDPNANDLGIAIHMIAADQLLMNKGNLDDTAELPGGDTERTQFIRRVMAHEMGHTLGLGQHESSTWHFTALMYSPTCTSCNNIQTPRSHDKADYHDLW